MPKREPDAASITLLGPGVNAMAAAKIRTAVKVCNDMTGRLGQIGPFEVWRPAHDGYLRRRLSTLPEARRGLFSGLSGVACSWAGRLLNPPSYRDFSLWRAVMAER